MKQLTTTSIAIIALAMYLTTPNLSAGEGARAYPDHWGEVPKKQTRDRKPMPAPFKGYASGTLVKWIKVNQSNFPKAWGNKPKIETADYTELPYPYGFGSSTLKNWIKKNLK